MRARHLSPAEAGASSQSDEDLSPDEVLSSTEDDTPEADEETASSGGDESSDEASDTENLNGSDAEETTEKKSKIPSLTPVIQALRTELANKDEQLKSYITAYKEATADMERERARLQRDRERTAERDRMDLASSLLDVLDNFDRSLESGRKGGTAEDLLAGLDLVHKQFLDALTGLGVERMQVLGETFDAGSHEATGMIPASGEQADQEVIFEERPGYTFKGQLLRPARVVVASRPD